MNDFKVSIVEINDILEHPNADRLSIATITGMGWQCVVGKGEYRTGQKALYFPIDSILPVEVETKIFGPESKVKLHKSRVRTVKLRKAISQGLLIPCELFGLEDNPVGTDVTEVLKVKKFEVPTPNFQRWHKNGPAKKQDQNPYFRKVTKFPNIKNYSNLFDQDEEVVGTEKVHGISYRAMKSPSYVDSWWKKILKFLKIIPKWQFVYGSHNIQISGKFLYKGYYNKNVYAEATHNYDIKNKIPNGYGVYGEIYGDSIQKGYMYGCTKNERKLAIFDVWTFNDKDFPKGRWLHYDELMEFCKKYDLPKVPELFRGKFKECDVEKLIEGNSVLAPEQKVREGMVLKTLVETRSTVGRKAVKCISPTYLLRDNTEFH